MKRFTVILLIISIGNINVNAKGRTTDGSSRLTYGFEWGYVATLNYNYYNYFLAPEGYRVEEMGNRFALVNNADVYAYIGYNLNPRWNLSLYLGYMGVAELHKAIPVSFRFTRFFGDDPAANRWLAFADLGSGISLKKNPQEILMAKFGLGYRLVLSRLTSLDFILAARMVHSHTQVHYDNIPVPPETIDQNTANIVALSIGMSLNF